MGTLNKSPAVHHGHKKFFKNTKRRKEEWIDTNQGQISGGGKNPTIEDNEFFLAMTQLFGNIFIKRNLYRFYNIFQR